MLCVQVYTGFLYLLVACGFCITPTSSTALVRNTSELKYRWSSVAFFSVILQYYIERDAFEVSHLPLVETFQGFLPAASMRGTLNRPFISLESSSSFSEDAVFPVA